MILNKYNRGKTSETTTYATSSTTSSTYGSNMDTDNIISGSGELDRWLWGVQDDGEDIDDTMFVGGSIYVQKDSQIADHENDDGDDDDWEPVYEPYPDDDGGNIYADGEIQAPYLYATDILYVPHPDTKEKTDIMELIPFWKYYSEGESYPSALIDCTASTNSFATLGVYSNPTSGSNNKIVMDVSGTTSGRTTEQQILLDTTGFYYNDCEVATKCTLEDYYTKTEADEKFQEKLKWYSETSATASLGADGVYIDSGTGGIHLTRGDTEFLVGDIVSYNGCEVATKCDLDDLKNIWYAKGTSSVISSFNISRSYIYPNTGTPEVGDLVLYNYVSSTSSSSPNCYAQGLYYVSSISGTTYTLTHYDGAIWEYDSPTLSGLGGIGTINASGTSPLTLSASKSGTTATITGSVDLSNYNTTSTWITNTLLQVYQTVDRSVLYPATGTVKPGDAILAIAVNGLYLTMTFATVDSVSGSAISWTGHGTVSWS